jgi:hypothetical protein
LRIVVNDCCRQKTLRISLVQAQFLPRQFFVRTRLRCATALQVSLTRVLTGLRKSLVRAL